ncbi:MAG TPA: CehA/McbA family metallohydrolase [Polyangia bacterium]|nr:CehA/McbA family metallohydrolase [Polyangia bacterium]
MSMRKAPMSYRLRLIALAACLAACTAKPPANRGPCAAAGITPESRFPAGSRDGHPDPAGAKAAGQARAGRITDARLIRQPDNARQPVHLGDYLLINDKIAAYIEAEGPSDGYLDFGGEILGIEPVGPDGLPLGVSQYGETLVTLSRQAVKPDSVTVLADGSDGRAAIVRVTGVLANVPFLDIFSVLAPNEYGYPAALDYVLEPGSEKVTLRLSLMNPTATRADFTNAQYTSFFQNYRGQAFNSAGGFGAGAGDVPLLAWDSGDYALAWRAVGSPLRFVISISGLQLYLSRGLTLDACATTTRDYAEVIPALSGIDGLLAAVRRVDGDTSWRTVTGRVESSDGSSPAGALVHATRMDGSYLTRARVQADGSFTLHAPPEPVLLQPTLQGMTPPAATRHAPGDAAPTLRFAADGYIVVDAREATTDRRLPSRVQVIPQNPPAPLPDAYGVESPVQGRLYQEFTTDGRATLRVPPGEHRVVVTRGAEWEMLDQTVTVAPGETVNVAARLVHSVDTTGVMCADFHIHSYYSVDASDPVEMKVRGAIADGLDIPVSSEHEWIIDFQPIIQSLGLEDWAYGFPSEELTTFAWGHFGIVPIYPRADAVNRGAISWTGSRPPDVFQRVLDLPERPLLIVNHPNEGSFGAAYFSVAHFNRTTASGDPGLWSDRFQAIEVFNDGDFETNRDSSVADWFALLDAGKRVWAVGNSDSHHLRTSPVGYPRTCLRVGHDDPHRLTGEIVRDTLARGEATVSAGLYMTVEGPGGVGPGGMIRELAGPLTFHVVVQAPTWLAADTLETLVDGQTVALQPLQEVSGSPARRYETDVEVTPNLGRAFHWVVFHAKAEGRDMAPLYPGRRPFAVSNPIFF